MRKSDKKEQEVAVGGGWRERQRHEVKQREEKMKEGERPSDSMNIYRMKRTYMSCIVSYVAS